MDENPHSTLHAIAIPVVTVAAVSSSSKLDEKYNLQNVPQNPNEGTVESDHVRDSRNTAMVNPNSNKYNVAMDPRY